MLEHAERSLAVASSVRVDGRMRVLLDHGTPVPLRRVLDAHAVATAFEMGWAQLSNGASY
jgi:hypothetical protein